MRKQQTRPWCFIIRDKYYYHVTNPRCLRELVKNGEYSKKEVERLKYKDAGECSCIAVAIEHPDKYVIVTEDEGKIFMNKEVKLFQIYKKSHNIKIWNYDTWARNTNYKKTQFIF